MDFDDPTQTPPAPAVAPAPPVGHDATTCDVCQAWLAHVHATETP